MKTTHDRLHACRLTPESHRQTCGYWYTVTCGSQSHTAFATRAGLNRWMSERGLHLAGSLDEEHSHCGIDGAYRTESHLHDADNFENIPGERSRTLSNGDWVEAILEWCDDGIVTVHTLNPNVRNRKVFDHRESRSLMDTDRHYCQCGPTSWILYEGSQAIWETSTLPDLMKYMRERGIRAEWRPLGIAVVR